MTTSQDGVKVTAALRSEQADYYRLCSEARTLNIPVACDDPHAPNTVDALRQAVEASR